MTKYKLPQVTKKKTTRGQLTKKEKREILRRIYEKNQGVTKVARKMGRSRGTLSYFLRKMETDGTTERKTILTKLDGKRVCRLVRKHPSMTLPQIKDRLSLDVSCMTISRHLIAKGFVCGSSRSHPVRTEA